MPGRRRARGDGQCGVALRAGTTRTVRSTKIAGVTNAGRNVVGIMPHPERRDAPALGGQDGAVSFTRWRLDMRRSTLLMCALLTIATSGCKADHRAGAEDQGEDRGGRARRNKSAQPAPRPPQPAAPAPPDVAATPPPKPGPEGARRCRCLRATFPITRPTPARSPRACASGRSTRCGGPRTRFVARGT